MKVLVTGATGYIGGRLVGRLLDDGYSVRCLARNPQKLSRDPWIDHVDVVQGDVLQPDTLMVWNMRTTSFTRWVTAPNSPRWTGGLQRTSPLLRRQPE